MWSGAGIVELVRGYSNVDAFGRANDAEDWITEDAARPSVVGAAPNKNLRDAFLSRKIDDRGYRIVAFQYFGGGSGFFRGVEIPSNSGSVPLGPAGLANIYRVDVALNVWRPILSSEGRSPSEGSVVELYAGSLLRNRIDRYDAKLTASRVHEGFYLYVAPVDSA